MSNLKQSDLLEKAKTAVKACHVCGGKTIEPKGFKPQSFSQNEDTYKILDKQGILYDAGFKAGILYLPGHENDKWPYRIDNHRIYAVPISSYNLSGERVYLSDRYIKDEKGMSSSKWYDLLISKLDESAKAGDPMVVVFDNLISGMDSDYLKAYLDFIKYATSKNATFVSTMELVNMTMARSPQDAANSQEGVVSPSSENTTMLNTTPTKCAVCESLKNVTITDQSRGNNSSSEKPLAMPKPKMSE